MCAVCNGPGRFLCCERCPRSFHFTCLNPPLEEVPEGMWFCNKCTTQHNPPPKPPRGLFVDLIDNINRRNPSSFRLPSEIRNYFVGVETGPLGEYVDVRDNKTQRFGYGDIFWVLFGLLVHILISDLRGAIVEADFWKNTIPIDLRTRAGISFSAIVVESLLLMVRE